MKARLEKLAGSRLTQEGVLVLFAQGSRSQEMNRQDARERLIDLIRRATEKPKPRKKTKAQLQLETETAGRQGATRQREVDARQADGGLKDAVSPPALRGDRPVFGPGGQVIQLRRL